MNITNTLEWDTVFALPISKVNESISSPEIFQYNFGKGRNVRGGFGKWEIVPGGDGSIIHLQIPIENVQGHEDLLGKFSWESSSVVVAVKLNFLPHEDSLEKNIHALKVRTNSDDKNDPVITLVSTGKDTMPKYEGKDVFQDTDAMQCIGELITEGLTENLKEFNHIFATVNLNEKIDRNKGWTWCKPTYVDYAYVDRENKDGVLGILCMTGGREASTQQKQQIDPSVIPDGSISGFLISEERILKDLILPVLPLKWTDSTVEDYEMIRQREQSTGKYQHVLQLKEGKSIKLSPVHNLISYTPFMKGLSITLEDGQFIFETYTETKVELGMIAWCRTKHYYKIKLAHKQHGGQTLDFEEIGKVDVRHGVLETTETRSRKMFLDILGIVTALVLDVFTGGIAAIIGGAILLLLAGLAAHAGEILISLEHQDTSPSIGLAFSNMTSPIKWNTKDVFTLNSATLAGPLQFGGTPHF